MAWSLGFLLVLLISPPLSCVDGNCIMFCLLGQVTGCDSDLLLGVSCYYWMLPLDVAVIN